MGSKRPGDLEWIKTQGTENMVGLQFCEKTCFYYFRLDLNESREGFCQRGRGMSFHVDGPKTEKAQEPKVESLVRGIWRLRVSEAEWRVWEGV